MLICLKMAITVSKKKSLDHWKGLSKEGAEMAQWREYLPLTNVARVRFPDLVSCWLSLLLVLVLALRVFSPGASVFPSPHEPTFSNSSLT